MKKLAYLIPLFIALSCGPRNESLTTSEIDQVKSEIQPAIDQIIQGSSDADFAKAIASYSDSKEFISLSNGQALDYASTMAAHKTYFDGLQSQKFTEASAGILVLSMESAVFTWVGAAKIILKDSTQIDINPFAATLIFKKMDGQWKVIYTNEFTKVAPIDGLE